jgi:integrase
LLAEYAGKARGDRPRHPYEEAAQRFLDEASIRPKTHACYSTSNRMCLPTFKGRHLDEIDRRLLGEFVSRRKKDGVSDTTVRRDLAFLSSMCAMAIRWGWLDTNPVTAFSKRTLKEARPRTRFLSPAEYEALLAQAADHVRPAIILAVATGLRKEELFGLTIQAIDLPRREIILNQTKSGAPRRVPLSDTAITTIQAVIAQKDRPRGAAHLFIKADGSRYGDVKKGFAAACRRAKVIGLRYVPFSLSDEEPARYFSSRARKVKISPRPIMFAHDKCVGRFEAIRAATFAYAWPRDHAGGGAEHIHPLSLRLLRSSPLDRGG